MRSTRALHERIVLSFDFDKTLAPSTMHALLDVYGIDHHQWYKECVEPLSESGWDEILAHGFALIETGREQGRPIDASVIKEAAARVEPYPGVREMFGRLRRGASEVAEGVELEFGILSCGFVDIMRDNELADEFDRIWASSLHFDEDGVVRTVKRTITHPQKARYLEALAKGLDPDGANAPRNAAKPVDETELHVTYDQMIYVGDGASDVQAFGFLESRGGLALAINKGETFSAEKKMSPSQRVENLAPPDFTEGSELLRSLTLAVQSCAARIALRRMAQGE